MAARSSRRLLNPPPATNILTTVFSGNPWFVKMLWDVLRVSGLFNASVANFVFYSEPFAPDTKCATTSKLF
ncbi:hypothetical protein ABPG75_002456 [Micractinium tetrahymenae]